MGNVSVGGCSLVHLWYVMTDYRCFVQRQTDLYVDFRYGPSNSYPRRAYAFKMTILGLSTVRFTMNYLQANHSLQSQLLSMDIARMIHAPAYFNLECIAMMVFMGYYHNKLYDQIMEAWFAPRLIELIVDRDRQLIFEQDFGGCDRMCSYLFRLSQAMLMFFGKLNGECWD